MHQLVSFGEVLVDIFSSSLTDKEATLAGGAPANVAVCFAKLGGKATFVGGIADDEFGTFLLGELASNKVDTSYVIPFLGAKTARAIVTLDKKNDRHFKILRNQTADMLVRPKHIPKRLFESNSILHCCSNSLTESSIAETTLFCIETARKKNSLVSFDVNLRLDLWRDVEKLKVRVSKTLAYSHIVKLSMEELEFLANQEQVTHKEYMDKCFKLGVQLLIVTNGEKVIQCYYRGRTFIQLPDKISAVDTTGAGDAFCGGFLFNLSKQRALLDKYSQLRLSDSQIVDALQFAARCGSYACLTKGAFEAMPQLESLQQSNEV